MLLMLYLVAITAEAMTGALSAGRRGMDWFGVVLIACVTLFGGLLLRLLAIRFNWEMSKFVYNDEH